MVKIISSNPRSPEFKSWHQYIFLYINDNRSKIGKFPKISVVTLLVIYIYIFPKLI